MIGTGAFFFQRSYLGGAFDTSKAFLLVRTRVINRVTKLLRFTLKFDG
jgi:hypothetical protein